MADVTLSYKGSDILELSDSGSATLKTGGKYCEDDVTVEYVKPSSGGSVEENFFEVIDIIYDNKAGSSEFDIPISDGTKDNYFVTWAVVEHGKYTDGVLVMDTDIVIPTGMNTPIFGTALYRKNIENTASFTGSYSDTSLTNRFVYLGNNSVRGSLSTGCSSSSENGLSLQETADGYRMTFGAGYGLGKAGYYFKYRVKVHGWNNGTPNATPVIVNVT